MPRASSNSIANLLVVEQQAIAAYLDTKTAHIDRIIETIKAQKLKELRKTLINDVVTGKIKITQQAVLTEMFVREDIEWGLHSQNSDKP